MASFMMSFPLFVLMISQRSSPVSIVKYIRDIEYIGDIFFIRFIKEGWFIHSFVHSVNIYGTLWNNLRWEVIPVLSRKVPWPDLYCNSSHPGKRWCWHNKGRGGTDQIPWLFWRISWYISGGCEGRRFRNDAEEWENESAVCKTGKTLRGAC